MARCFSISIGLGFEVVVSAVESKDATEISEDHREDASRTEGDFFSVRRDDRCVSGFISSRSECEHRGGGNQEDCDDNEAEGSGFSRKEASDQRGEDRDAEEHKADDQDRNGVVIHGRAAEHDGEDVATGRLQFPVSAETSGEHNEDCNDGHDGTANPQNQIHFLVHNKTYQRLIYPCLWQ